MVIRPLDPEDAEELTALRLRNRANLEPWELDADDPERWYTRRRRPRTGSPTARIRFAILDAGELAGMLSLTGIDRGPIQTAMLSYFVDEARSGRGPRDPRRRGSGPSTRSESSACIGSRPAPRLRTSPRSACSSTTASRSSGRCAGIS